MRTKLYVSMITLYVQIIKFGFLFYCWLEIVTRIKNKLSAFLWAVGIGSALMCPLIGVFKFVDLPFVSHSKVEQTQEFLAFTAGTVGGLMVGFGIIQSVLFTKQRSPWWWPATIVLGTVFHSVTYYYALITGDSFYVDVVSMAALVASFAACLYAVDKSPRPAAWSVVGLTGVALAILVRERFPNTAYFIQSTDAYELTVVISYIALYKSAMFAEIDKDDNPYENVEEHHRLN